MCSRWTKVTLIRSMYLIVEYAMEAIKVSFRDPDFAADQHKLATTAAAFPCANDSGTS